MGSRLACLVMHMCYTSLPNQGQLPAVNCSRPAVLRLRCETAEAKTAIERSARAGSPDWQWHAHTTVTYAAFESHHINSFVPYDRTFT